MKNWKNIENQPTNQTSNAKSLYSFLLMRNTMVFANTNSNNGLKRFYICIWWEKKSEFQNTFFKEISQYEKHDNFSLNSLNNTTSSSSSMWLCRFVRSISRLLSLCFMLYLLDLYNWIEWKLLIWEISQWHHHPRRIVINLNNTTPKLKLKQQKTRK